MFFRSESSETRFQIERKRMVETQLAARGIVDPRVLDAMAAVPRHRFIPLEYQASAYADHPVQIGYGQTISQPYMVALMTQLLEVLPADTVLEIGSGSGYQTAILAELCRHVWSIERYPQLADAARERLQEMGYRNVTIITGDGSLGYAEQAPYERILVTAAGPQVPDALKNQLAAGGLLICPVGPRDVQRLALVRRTAAGLTEEENISCVFVPLIGEEGWRE